MIPQVDPPWKWGVYTGKGVAEPSKPRTHEGGEVCLEEIEAEESEPLVD